ncbi:MAG TPA: hypothetical protein VN631_16815 [Negativicutes bacterium]|nr:hypothetical protein [Negativicutes bacterium]
MLPFILAAVVGGMVVKNMTDYPSEIRKLRGQIPKDEREDFMRDYKSLPNQTKTQFKQYLREANMVEAGKLIGKDLSGYSINAKGNEKNATATPVLDASQDSVGNTSNGFNERIKNILNSYQLDSDPQLVAEAAKRYESISGYNQMNIVEKTRTLLDVSQ